MNDHKNCLKIFIISFIFIIIFLSLLEFCFYFKYFMSIWFSSHSWWIWSGESWILVFFTMNCTGLFDQISSEYHRILYSFDMTLSDFFWSYRHFCYWTFFDFSSFWNFGVIFLKYKTFVPNNLFIILAINLIVTYQTSCSCEND